MKSTQVSKLAATATMAWFCCSGLVPTTECVRAQSLPGHWVPSLSISFPHAQANSIAFIDSAYGIALIDSGTKSTRLYRTTDGGLNWSLWGSNDSGSVMFPGVTHSLQLLTKRNVYYAGASSDYWVSDDSGQTFQLDLCPWNPTNFIAASMFTPEFGRVVVGYPQPSLQVYETRDAGLSFQSRSNTISTLSISDAFFFDSSFWLVASSYKNILRTRDGGLSWDTLLNPSQVAFYIEIVTSRDRSRIYVTGGLASGKGYSSSFFKSTDTGNTWQADSSIYGDRIARMASPASGKLWALVRSGLQTVADSLFYSSNDGQTWASDGTTFAGQSLSDIVWPDSIHGFILAQNADTAIVYRYINDRAGVQEGASVPIQQQLFVSYWPSPATTILHCKLLGTSSAPGASLSAGLYSVLGSREIDLSSLANRGNKGTFSFFDIDVSSVPAGIYEFQCSIAGHYLGQPVVIFH